MADSDTNTIKKLSEPEVIVFVDASRRRKKSLGAAKLTDDDRRTESREKGNLTIDMKRARFDVKKFGISGFDKSRKKQEEISLAIQLGAHKPKNKHFNVKDARKIANEKKELEVERKKNEPQLEKMPKKKSSQRKKQRKSKTNLIKKPGKLNSKLRVRVID